MKITPLFKHVDLTKYIQINASKIENLAIKHFISVGKQFVNLARSPHAYQNYTGNLESSIACEVRRNGAVVYADYKKAGSGSDRATGVRKAKAFIEQLAEEMPNGIALIVVAGMEYAAYVEARQKDVITGSSLIAKKLLKQAIDDIRQTALR